MILKTVIFVDGQNFKKNLQEFIFARDEGREFRLDEKHFHWADFFRDVIKKFDDSLGREHYLLRAYWYYADVIIPFIENRELARKVSEKYQKTFPDLLPQRVLELARKWYDEERKNFTVAKENVYERIQRESHFLEFKYVGQYVVRPYDVYSLFKDDKGSLVYRGKRVGEKGVDVGIAVDMIAKMGQYDVAILVSGDSDFLPAVRYLKDNLKQVYQFSIAQGIPPKINYLSPWLKSIADYFQFFDEEELLGHYLNKASGIPPSVLKSIEQRLAELRQQRGSAGA